MSHGSGPSLTERLVLRWARWAGARPFRALALLLSIAGLCGWYGSGIQIRSNMEDLFPETTPAVVEAKKARDTLKSSSQLTVVFGSPDREANRALATQLCDAVQGWPEIAATECRRDIEFFRKNAALFLSLQELEDLDAKAKAAITKAAEKELVDDDLLEGLDDDEAEDAPGDASAVVASGQPAVEPPADASAADGRIELPTDEDLKKRFAADDIREWVESEDGQVLGIKLYPTIAPMQVDASAAFVAKLSGRLAELQKDPKFKDIHIAMSGDYAEMSEEVDQIKSGLFVTSTVALVVIALIQVLHFRRFRAIVLMSLPLVVGSLLTVAFARASLGYFNMVTAFIFSMLFGMGNDFNVYTLSRYLEERAEGHDPQTAVENTVVGLVRALHQAALTTSVAFFALIILDFRGFSQFGLIAGVGVELALASTILLFPPMVMGLYRLSPDKPATAEQAEGARWLGWFAIPKVARTTVVLAGLAAIWGGWQASNYQFETNMRKLRTISKNEDDGKATNQSARKLQYAYRSKADGRSGSPTIVVLDTPEEARVVHNYLTENKKQLHRVRYFVSLATFVPDQQTEKMAVISRIKDRLNKKLDALEGETKADAERALDLLRAEPFVATQLPAFVKNRFLDKQDTLGRFVLIYPNGNVLEAESIRELMGQIGRFDVRGKSYASTAGYFIVAEADTIVKKEGPIAVLLAAIAVFAVILWHFKNLQLCVYSFLPLTLSFVIFLGLAKALGLSLNLFSVTALPGILGIGIDGTTHILHRWWEDGEKANVRMILQQVGGAAWIALVTTTVGFTALLFQDNQGLQSIAWMATLGLFSVCLLSNILAGAIVAVWPPRRS